MNSEKVRQTEFFNVKEVGQEIENFKLLVSQMRMELSTDSTFDFMQNLKRLPLHVGPYKGVTWLEAANRILTDCVIYNALNKIFEGSINELAEVATIKVDFGHTNLLPHDMVGYDKKKQYCVFCGGFQ